MFLKSVYLALTAAAALAPQKVLGQSVSADTHFNITALASRDGYSVIECWQLAATGTYARSAMNWIVGGDTTYAQLSVIEPRVTPGEAWAPSSQLTMILHGMIRITTPFSPPPLNATTAYIIPGTMTSSVLIAADTNKTSYKAGHYTEFPSDSGTVLAQLPFANDEVPEHTVLHDGPCGT